MRALVALLAVTMLGMATGTGAEAELRLTIGEEEYKAMLRDGYSGGVKCSHNGCVSCPEIRVGAVCTWMSTEELQSRGIYTPPPIYLPPPQPQFNWGIEAGRGMIEGLQRDTPPPPVQCNTQPNGPGWRTTCRR